MIMEIEEIEIENMIQHNAQMYEDLLHKSYEFIVRLPDYPDHDFAITVRFYEQNFADLSGLSKLKDLDWLPKDKTEIFDMALSGRIKEKKLRKSKYYKKYCIAERTEHLCELEHFMDTYINVYHCKEYQTKKGLKRYHNAEMFVCDDSNEDSFFIFFRRKNKYSTKYVPIDFLPSSRFKKKDPRGTEINETADLMRKSRRQ